MGDRFSSENNRDWLKAVSVTDLYILVYTHEGVTSSAIARRLCVTPGAVCQRIKKLNTISAGEIFSRNRGAVCLTEDGVEVATLAARALEALGLKDFKGFDDREGETTECGFLGPGD